MSPGESMNIRITGTYRSISEMEWCDVPPLAILSGENGVGKSQLLEVLAHSLGSYESDPWTNHRYSSPDIRAAATFENAEFIPGDVHYARSDWRPIPMGSCTVETIQQAIKGLHSENTPQQKPGWWTSISKSTGLELTQLLALPQEEFITLLTPGILWSANYSPSNHNLAFLFQAYRLFEKDAMIDGLDRAAVVARYGEAPWLLLNEILETAALPYRIDTPEPLAGRQLVAEPPLVITMRDKESGCEIPFDALSSGEKVIMSTVLWRYGAQVAGRYYKLLLLDEPDAHLHPSLTRSFLDVLDGVFVRDRGVRVIITTHSPSTVALAPSGATFIMSRNSPRISRAKSKADAVGRLTAGLITVSEGTRYVLVEDESDVRFYDAIRDILSDFGPSRDARAIKPAPSIVFLPASLGRGTEKTGGGKSVVSGWVDKLSSPPFDVIFRGLIDLDDGNVGTDRVHVLERHSIENYLADPIVLYALLSAEGKAPEIAGMSLTKGDEHLLREMSHAQLQTIVDAIHRAVAAIDNEAVEADAMSTSVTFTNGESVDYPRWMLKRRGHDLLRMYQSLFGASLITPPRLLSSLRRVRLVPVELAHIMRELQG